MTDTERRWVVVHPKISYPSTDTGQQTERHAGDVITDIAPTNWLIREGLVVPVPPDADPVDVLAAHRAPPGDPGIVGPVPDVIVAVVPAPEPPHPRRRAPKKD